MLKQFNQNNLPIISFFVILLALFFINFYLIYDIYYLDLGLEEVILTPEMEKLYKQLESKFFKN